MHKTCLIGHTGFIGGNLARQYPFADCFHSKTIDQIRGKSYDLLVCSGVRAAKWWANQHPEEDRASIDRLLDCLHEVRARRAILISTVDVYPVNSGVDETFDCRSRPNHAYGLNRLHVEDALTHLFHDLFIVRLPGMFGPGLKKNVIYDLLHDNCLEAINPDSSFQYYDVTRLWTDLNRMQEHDLRLVNFSTEPLETHRILDEFFPGKKVGMNASAPVAYDIRSRHAEAFGGTGGYLYRASQILSHMEKYIHAFREAVLA